MKYRQIRKIKKKNQSIRIKCEKKSQRKELIYVIYHKTFLHS